MKITCALHTPVSLERSVSSIYMRGFTPTGRIGGETREKYRKGFIQRGVVGSEIKPGLPKWSWDYTC